MKFINLIALLSNLVSFIGYCFFQYKPNALTIGVWGFCTVVFLALALFTED